MSDEGINNPDGSAAPEEMPVAPRRAASVQLRDAQASVGSELDQANQSLAEALRVTFRLVQLAMVIIVGLYVFSGLSSVEASERAIKVIFGKAEQTVLDPGPQLSPPYPIGELVKVDVGLKNTRINRAFWPFVPEGQEESTAPEQLANKQQLDPETDGSLLTADGNIVHSQWAVEYSTNDPLQYATNVYTPDVEMMVRSAVQRAIIRAVSLETVESLLTQARSEAGSVTFVAKRLAQETLDKAESGIRIQELSLSRLIPPRATLGSFDSVQNARTKRAQDLETARSEAATLLTNAAGAAADELIEQIDLYELALEAENATEAEAAFAAIQVLLGETGGDTVVDTASTGSALGGEASAMLSEARQARTTAASTALNDLESFRAKLQQYRSQPSVAITREWASAFADFRKNELVEMFQLPVGASQVRLQLARDPEIAKAAERKINEDRAEQTRQAREEARRIQQAQTSTGRPAQQ
ncbi:MAG: SPFH domain-containing protein [Planctomycetota bacterium]